MLASRIVLIATAAAILGWLSFTRLFSKWRNGWFAFGAIMIVWLSFSLDWWAPKPIAPTTQLPMVSASSSPDLNAEILKQLQEIQRSLPKSSPPPPFLISAGPILLGRDVNASSMYITFSELSTKLDPHPIQLEPANLIFYVGVLNQQSIPSMVQAYKVEVMNKSGKWVKLKRLDTLGGVHVYWSAGNTRQFFPLDSNEFFDSAVYHKSLRPQGEPALGWVLFRYPPDVGEIEPSPRIRMTIYDPNGRKTASEIGKRNTESEGEGGPQGAGFKLFPAIQLPAEQAIIKAPY